MMIMITADSNNRNDNINNGENNGFDGNITLTSEINNNDHYQ